MLKSYDLPNGLRLQYEEGTQPAGAVEHVCAPVAAPAKKAEPVKDEKPVEEKKAPAKNKAVTPKNKAKAAKKK